MFAINLAQYSEIVQAIVTTAVRELAIETEVSDIEHLWKTMEFTVVKHYKGDDPVSISNI